MNEKIYIHEFVDIVKQNRAAYMYHMAVNFSPMAQDDRGQLCYGVFGVVGSTKRWPEVVNIWEEDGWDGMAASFGHELSHDSLQDPKLARWWAAAADLRSGGTDRLLIPAPWTRTITELLTDGVTGVVHAHEQIRVEPGTADAYLEFVRTRLVPVYEPMGWELAGAWKTVGVDDAECFLHWAIPTWDDWARFERAYDRDPAIRQVREDARRLVKDTFRFLMVDAPHSPFRLGRQPAREDRTEEWIED